MPPVENQPVKPNQPGAEFGLEPPQLYGFTGDGSALPNPYQFTGDGQEVKSGPQIYLGPAGQDWGPRIGPSERRIDQMPEGPQKDAALARETNVLFNVPVALKAYRDDIKAADAIDQTEVVRRNTANVALLKENQTQLAQAKAMNASPEQMNALLGKQQELQNTQKLIVGDYYAPATTRINAGLALITTGQDMLVDYGQNLIGEALKLRPELRDNPLFNKNLEAARQACIKNREAAFSGEMKDPYQFTGDGSVPGGIPQKRPGLPGQPGRGPDGRPLPDGNPGFTPIPGYDAPPQQQVQPFPQFRRGGETPDNARKDKPQQKPKEDFTPPAQPPKEKGVDKGVWDQMNDGQKLLAAALAAFLGYKLVQRGNRILAERSRDAGNEALGKTPENAAKLKEAIERAGKEFARDNVIKAKLLKEGEHAGKYEVTRPDGKKEFMSETDFKDKYSETGKPGEYKSWLSDRSKAVQLPELAELNAELGLGKQADRKMWAVVENGEVKLLTDKEFKQGWRQPTDADKASWDMEAERKLTPEQKAEKAAAEQKAAEEKAAADKLAAEQKAAEEKAAADKLAAEQKAAEEKAAADKLAAEQKAAEEKAAADKLAAEQKAAEEKAAADKLAAEQKAAEEKAAADKLAAEQKAAEEKAAADKLAAEKAAADKLASEGRFKPAPGSEIIAGIKVDQTATVDGVTWKAVGKTEDKIIFKKEAGITRSETPLQFDAKDFNRVELSGEKGIYFQRKGSNTMYQYFPLDGKQALEPGAGNGFLFKLDGVEARPLGSPIVRAMLNPASTTGTPPVEGPKTEVKPEEGPRRPRRGAAPSADRISGVDHTPAPDGTMKRTSEVVGKRLIGTDATAKDLLVADEVKMLETRVEELEKKAKENKIEAKERVELAAHKYVLENLNRPEVHKGMVERMAASRPAGGFRLGEVRSAGVGVAILATAALALYISSQPQGQYTAPERARIGG